MFLKSALSLFLFLFPFPSPFPLSFLFPFPFLLCLAVPFRLQWILLGEYLHSPIWLLTNPSQSDLLSPEIASEPNTKRKGRALWRLYKVGEASRGSYSVFYENPKCSKCSTSTKICKISARRSAPPNSLIFKRFPKFQNSKFIREKFELGFAANSKFT